MIMLRTQRLEFLARSSKNYCPATLVLGLARSCKIFEWKSYPQRGMNVVIFIARVCMNALDLVHLWISRERGGGGGKKKKKKCFVK